MKIFEILDKGNSYWRLTVTPTRIAIKIKSGENIESDIYRAFLNIANNLNDVDKAYRGKLSKNELRIDMYNDSKTVMKTFYIKDYI